MRERIDDSSDKVWRQDESALWTFLTRVMLWIDLLGLECVEILKSGISFFRHMSGMMYPTRTRRLLTGGHNGVATAAERARHLSQSVVLVQIKSRVKPIFSLAFRGALP